MQCAEQDIIVVLQVASLAMVKPHAENHGHSVPANEPVVTGPRNPQTSSGPQTVEASGCATSFLNEKNNQTGAVCGGTQRDPEEEYVQKNEEKELGGEA